MSKTTQAFQNGKALIPFITAGDPSLDVTEQLVYAMANAGADLIELGIPFSDPVAEGEVIERASARALHAGTTADAIFGMLARVRVSCWTPIALMTYYNPVFVYGRERFLQNCARCCVDALTIPDLPFEEREELTSYAARYDVDLIEMIAPTSHERIADIARVARGFLYCVSSMGVTGVRGAIKTDIGAMVAQAKRANPDVFCAVGFGISNTEQAVSIAREADGVIIGSAIVKLVEQYGEQSVPIVANYVEQMKKALRSQAACVS